MKVQKKDHIIYEQLLIIVVYRMCIPVLAEFVRMTRAGLTHSGISGQHF